MCFGFDVQGLAHPQAALVDEREVGAVTAVAEGASRRCDFLAGQDVGKGLRRVDLDLLPDVPDRARGGRGKECAGRRRPG